MDLAEAVQRVEEAVNRLGEQRALECLTVRQVAELAQVDRRTVYAAIEAGTLRGSNLSTRKKRQIRVTWESFRAWLDSTQMVGAPKPTARRKKVQEMFPGYARRGHVA